MSKILEKKLIGCKKCNPSRMGFIFGYKKTVHIRNGSSMGLIGILINLVLVIITVGAWLIPLIAYLMLNVSVGGWNCSKCMDKPNL